MDWSVLKLWLKSRDNLLLALHAILSITLHHRTHCVHVHGKSLTNLNRTYLLFWNVHINIHKHTNKYEAHVRCMTAGLIG